MISRKPIAISEVIGNTLNLYYLRKHNMRNFLKGYFLRIYTPVFNEVLGNTGWQNFVTERYLKGDDEPYTFIIHIQNDVLRAELKWSLEQLRKALNERMKGEFLSGIQLRPGYFKPSPRRESNTGSWQKPRREKKYY